MFTLKIYIIVQGFIKFTFESYNGTLCQKAENINMKMNSGTQAFAYILYDSPVHHMLISVKTIILIPWVIIEKNIRTLEVIIVTQSQQKYKRSKLSSSRTNKYTFQMYIYLFGILEYYRLSNLTFNILFIIIIKTSEKSTKV